MLRRIRVLILLLLAVLTIQGQIVSSYEYWVDADFAHKVTSADDVESIDISGLSAGVHYLNFRTRDGNGEAGIYHRYLFFVPASETVEAPVSAYEYWVDADFAHKVTSSDDVESIDISGLSAGVHYLNFRTRDGNGEAGIYHRYLFFVPASETVEAPLSAYEYWVDADFAHKVTSSDDVESIDIGGLSAGVHYLNFRTRNNDGKAGIYHRYLFYMPGEDTSAMQLQSVEYWIDERQGVLYQPITDSTIVISMDITNLPAGRHTFNIEGKTANDYSYLLASYEFDMDEISGDAYFDGLLATVSGKRMLDEAFDSIGGRSEAAKTIAAIIWNKAVPITQSDLHGIDNPNLLVYVNEASLAPSNITNVVVNGVAKNVVLIDANEGNNNFYCPQAFTAEMINYTREFRQQTQVGVSRGWESIALPFTVQTITHERNGALSPFGSDGNGKPFWLRKLGGSGLTQATSIEANVPYIISMPNNIETYPAKYNQAGKVTFSAENVTIPVTEPVTLAMADSTLKMTPAFQRVSRSSDVWAINIGEMRGQYLEGSVFERGYREVRPFEAYIVHKSNSPAPRFVSIIDINGTTGIETIGSNTQSIENWYSLDGRRLQRQPKGKGVYISGKRKVIVR